MPIYEYQCQKCQHQFEEIQKVSDPHVAKCPECDGTVDRLISQTSFSLKGGGWYKDGYAKPSSTGEKKDTKKPESAPPPPAAISKKD